MMNPSCNLGQRRARVSLGLALAVLSVQPASAYVDPGTGSMLVQMGIAAVAGAMFYFRQFRMAAAAWLRRVVLRQKEQSSIPESAQRSADEPT